MVDRAYLGVNDMYPTYSAIPGPVGARETSG